MSAARTSLSTVLIVLGFMLLLTTVNSRPRQNTGGARALFDSANRERRARGLPELKWDQSLALAAQRHAQLMADKNTLSHQLPGEEDVRTRASRAGAHFSKIAENIGYASSVEVIHDQWMHSPPHRANILDKDVDSIGIAVDEGDRVLFAVEDFSRAVVMLGMEDQEKRIGMLLAAKGLRLLNDMPNDVDTARRQCALQSGTPKTRRSVLVFRFTTDDLKHLPPTLEQTLQGEHYRSAAVGACAPDRGSGFTSYRLAVLLY